MEAVRPCRPVGRAPTLRSLRARLGVVQDRAVHPGRLCLQQRPDTGAGARGGQDGRDGKWERGAKLRMGGGEQAMGDLWKLQLFGSDGGSDRALEAERVWEQVRWSGAAGKSSR